MTDRVKIFGSHERVTLMQFDDLTLRPELVGAALMADGHLGYGGMPVGGVIASRSHVFVGAVGFDIGCGNCALRTNLLVHEFRRDDLELLADEIRRVISFGVGRSNLADDAPTDHKLFADLAWAVIPPDRRNVLFQRAKAQLGTVGGGNHYVDVFADETGCVWVGVHFGSRGFGHGVASDFLSLAVGQGWGGKVPEHAGVLPLGSNLADDYLALMHVAGTYARVGREYVAGKVAGILGGTVLETVHNHHNFAWWEVHGGERLLVTRKGATPAFPLQRGFVGGSMGDDAVILRGARPTTLEAKERQEAAFYSTVHGAGRVMGRADAKRGRAIRGADGRPTGKRDVASRITREMADDWLDRRGVVVRGGDVDEAPQAYRRLPDVLAAMGDTVVVEHTLTPLIVVMAEPKTHDPYKD